MRKRSAQMSKPPKHGEIKTSTRKVGHAKKHLKAATASMAEVRDYEAHGEGQSSRGAFTGSGMSSGASGADYQTTNVGGTADADSGGPTGL